MDLLDHVMDQCCITKWPVSLLTVCFGVAACATAGTDPALAVLSGVAAFSLAAGMVSDIRDEYKKEQAHTGPAPRP